MPTSYARACAKQVCVWTTGALAALAVVSMPVQGASLVVEWDPTTNRTDESALVNLAGYRVYYGVQSGVYDQYIEVGTESSATLDALADGVTYYIAVTAVDHLGLESQRSEEIAWNSRDTDMDQLPDLWEVDRFGAIEITSADPAADWDADGMMDREEFIAGTHPADARSVLLLEAALVDGRPVVSFVATKAEGPGYAAGARRMFAIEFSQDLQQWQPCAGMPLSGNNQTVNQSVEEPMNQVHYRLSCWMENDLL